MLSTSDMEKASLRCSEPSILLHSNLLARAIQKGEFQESMEQFLVLGKNIVLALYLLSSQVIFIYGMYYSG